jgi:hypothetical protein
MKIVGKEVRCRFTGMVFNLIQEYHVYYVIELKRCRKILEKDIFTISYSIPWNLSRNINSS